MRNNYINILQNVMFFMLLFSQGLAAQNSNGSIQEPASNSSGKPRYTVTSVPKVDPSVKKNAIGEVLVVSPESIKEQPTLSPDLRKHPELGMVKLEGSPNSVEEIALRDANSRTFKNADGSFTKQQTKGVFHYKDAQGYWRTIGQSPVMLPGGKIGIAATDLPILINTSSGATQMQLDRKGGSLLFGEKALVQYIDATGKVVSTLIAKEATSHMLLGNELTLNGMWPAIDRKQHISYYQVETDYILQNRPTVALPGGSMVFTENITLPAGWKIVEGRGEETAQGWKGALEIVDQNGTLKGRFDRLVFYDSNEDVKQEGQALIGTYTYSQIGNIVTLGVIVPMDWLTDAKRQYPVTIDPTATNTYGNNGDLYYAGFNAACQEQMNVNVPAGTITGTASTYTVRAYLDAWRSEQRSRVGVGATWTATQNGTGNNNGSNNYSLTGQTIANGAHGGGNIAFTWQGFRTYLSFYDWFYCDLFTQELLSNTWVVTVTYTTSPCSGNPNAGTLAISAATGCSGSTNYTLTSTGYTTTGSGLEYNFQHADAGTGTWVDLTGWVALGGSNPTYTTNTTVAKDYRIQYRCSGGAAQNSNTVTHTPLTCIYLNVNQQVQTTCAAKIYDSGGPSGNYANNEARVVIIYPTSSDQILTVSGSYATESGFDFISATDGVSSDISTYLNPYFNSGSGTFTISAPGPGIPLTIKFQSDGNTVGAGFDLNVSCSCAVPTAGTAVAQNIITCGETSDIYFSGADGQDLFSFANTSFVGNTLPSGATISGNATVTGEYVRLTSTATSQTGSLVFNNTNGLDGNQFLSYFKIFAGGGSGADGMSFSFGPNISTTPGGSETGHGNGIKLSFDSYNNGAGVTPNCNGTNYSSVYLMYDNTVLGCYTTFNYTSWRNAWRLMVVVINENGQITVSNSEPGGPVYFNNVQLPAAYLAANKSTWKVAFSARTGGATDNHYVDDVNVYFGNQFEYSINNGSTWSNSTAFNGLAAGTYNPIIRNKNVTCGNRALTAITIDGPPTLPTIPTVSNNGPICAGGSVALTSSGLAPGGKVANLTGTQTISGNLVTAAVNSFTMEFWVKPTATRATTTQSNTGTVGTSAQRYAIDPAFGNTNAGAGVSVGTDGISVFEHGAGYLPSTLVYDFQTPKTEWMHVAVVYNNRIPTLYINGVFVKTGVVSARSNVYASSGTGSSYGYYNGQLDNIRIWNNVRTSAEIRANMNIEVPANNTGLVARYDFNASNVNASFGSPNNTNGGATFVDASYYTYTWSGTNAPAATTSETVNVSSPLGTYTVNYNTSNNCGSVNGGSTAVTVNAIPTAAISGTQTICAGGSSTFTASGGGTYAWSTGATTAAINVTTAGTYTVTVTNSGCTATASRALTVTPLPTAAISGTQTICAGGSSTFTASGGGTYAWSTGATTAAINVTTAGTYTVTVTNSGCTATASRALTVTPLPTAAISGTQTICAGGSSTFTASGGGTYAWGTGATTAAINVTTAGTYTVTVTNSGCTATTSLALTVTPLPTAAISGTQTICAGGSSTFTASGGGTYAWSTGATTAAINVTTAGTYTVTVTNSGCTATASRALTVTPLPTAAISGTQTICAGGSSTFTASGGGTYAWSTGATTAAINVTTAGTYTVTVTNSGCTATDSRALTVTPLPTAAISGTQTICAGGSSTFTASGGGTYAWSTGATTAAINVTTAGTYTVTVTNSGCTATASRALTVTPLPTAAISGTQTICAGGSSTFTASGGGTYAWSTGATTAAINVTTAGTYTVTVTNSGCTATASRTLTVTPLPTAAISGTQTICAGGSSTFTASGGGTYAWSTGATTAAINVTTAGTYTVTVTNSGCTATASRALTVTPLPTAAISGTQTICAGGSSTFTASGGGTYAWSTGATTAAINVTTAGTYTVTVTNSGCTATASRALTVTPLPTAAISGTQTICAGGSSTFTASGGGTYAWSTGATTAAINVTTAGTYTVTVTNSGCTATASRTLTVTPLPTAAISGTQTICAGGSSTFTASGGGTYAWSTGATTAAINVTTAGTYTVTVTNSGCTATDSRTLTVNAIPTVGITPASPSVCNGASTTLTASGGVSYAWSTGSAIDAATVTPSSTTSYTVTVTGSNGCTATGSKSVTVTQLTISGGTFQTGDYVFSGTTSASWAVAGNWYQYNGTSFVLASAVPATTNNIFVYPTTASTCIVRNTVNLAATNNANNVNIMPGATINGTNNTRTISVYGNWTNDGTFTMGNSTVAFRGSANTTASAGASSFYNLTINKSTTGALVEFLESFSCTEDFLVTQGTVQIPQDVVGQAEDISIQAAGALVLKQKTSGTKGGELRVIP